MASSDMDIKDFLVYFNKYSKALYYLIQDNKIDISEIENLFKIDDLDLLNKEFDNLIDKYKVDLDVLNNKKDKYSKLTCLDRIINTSTFKYQHLRDIRDVVNLEDKVELMIKDSTYYKSLNLYYLEKIIKHIFINNKDNLIINKYYNYLKDLIKDSDKDISINIDDYYISIITS